MNPNPIPTQIYTIPTPNPIPLHIIPNPESNPHSDSSFDSDSGFGIAPGLLESKKLTSIKRPSTHVVDGACFPEDISDVFVSKYETLFQSIPTDANDLQSIYIYRDIRSGVEYDDKCYSSITVGDVIDGLKSIKHGKQDGNYGLNNVRPPDNSSNNFKIVLSMVMSSMMVHGYNANDLLTSTVISIPKNTRGDMSQSDNYRGISMFNCICKLFDVIVMKKCDKVLHTSDQKTAFKQKHSTAMCSSVLIETVNYCVKGGSKVYGCLIDASKAFDRVHYGKLFSLLMSKGLPNVVVRFILDGYIRRSACIQWEGVKSRSFNTFNGVKQGGVISPILFSIYYAELVTRLSSSRYGCGLSGKFVGALAYSYDITLLCPSLHGLQEMVNTCADFGTDYHVTFNDKKKNCIVFGTSAVGCKCISVNDNEIMWSSW